jgi:hypothetical protein
MMKREAWDPARGSYGTAIYHAAGSLVNEPTGRGESWQTGNASSFAF